MKSRILILSFFAVAILIAGCSKDDEEKKEKTGVLVFKTLNPFAEQGGKSTAVLKSAVSNPPLTGDTTVTINTSMKICIGDIWVSQGEVKAGNADDLEWIRLTGVTNLSLKLMEDYTFSPKELPMGTYKSVKMSLKNIFYRYTVLASDNTVKYELLETMGSSFDQCNENDTSWVKPNYFSNGGNHKLNDGGVFEVVAPGEKIGGFTVEEGKTVILTWRFGAGVTVPCINYLIDSNGNREWDCGVDYIEYECPPDMEYMADFVIEYE